MSLFVTQIIKQSKMKKIIFLLLPAFALGQMTIGTTGWETHISSNTSWDGEVVMEGKIVSV